MINLNEYKFVDLSHELNKNIPIWDEISKEIVSIGETIIDYAEKGVEIQKFSFPGQFGTHIDFPAHFIVNGKRESGFNIKDFVLPLFIIDVSEKVSKDYDYCITLEDVYEHEKKYGAIPKNSFVAMRTDWYKNWPDKIHNVDINGVEHCPGWSIDVLKFLIETRRIKAIGHETMDTDSSKGIKEKGYICENYILKKERYQVELLCNLDKVPSVGAYIIVLPLNIPNSNGIPVRAIGMYHYKEGDKEYA